LCDCVCVCLFMCVCVCVMRPCPSPPLSRPQTLCTHTQTHSHTHTHRWPAIMFIYPVLGRIWCSVCPFMIYGEWAQNTLKKVFPTYKLKKWPKSITQEWGPWFLYGMYRWTHTHTHARTHTHTHTHTGLFAVILYWEELWDLPQTASLSAWLLLLITAGAVVFSLQVHTHTYTPKLTHIIYQSKALLLLYQPNTHTHTP
jgi:hypothetical protein